MSTETAMSALRTTPIELLGFIAAFCTTAAFVPQLVRVVRLRSAREISLGTFLLFSIGVFLWLLYGLYIGSKPVIASNTLTLVLSISILVLKLRYDRHALDKLKAEDLEAMSHEGIRIVSAAEARSDAHQELNARLPTDAVTPLKVRVKKSEGTGVEIDWRDGHQSSWNFRWLRDACPCATCHDERDKSSRAPGEPKPQSLLMMYEAPPRPVEVTPVGKYALKFKWNDGHEAGIYSWEYLRRVCQCPLCHPPTQPPPRL